jgi:hypothetical protein
VGNCAVSKLDACFSVLNNDIASNVGLTLFAHAHDTVVTTAFDLVSPQDGGGTSRLVVTNYFDAVFMCLFNQIIDDSRLVVQNFNAAVIKHEFVLVDLTVKF